ncbi:Indigoidine synthase A like protein [Popillia japonica]|uniref:Indigoidine synthase A like protein n=1 Tax=Popillia japonica TaxID=7064 RepID=A0AAW1KLR2_POPJA
MLTGARSLRNAYSNGQFRNIATISTNTNKIFLSEEVQHGLENGIPIVALESTIITHGMPYPQNIECALEVEDILRKKGVIPATIAILEGKIKAGLNKKELSFLGDIKTSNPIKTSRRDLAYVVAHKRNGGTTVSGTLIVAGKAGIPIFATGGLGGVHREAEKTFDISADLIELGKTPVAVFSSGIKSILDIAKTLEYLETQGVLVATYGDTNDFPGFYTSKSGFKVPYNITDPREAALIIRTNKEINLGSGILFGVPVPEEYSLNKTELDNIITKALNQAENQGVSGKEITPFLLSRVAEATAGNSLKTNIALVKNNASAAADVAVELSGIVRNKGSNDNYRMRSEPGRSESNKAPDNEDNPKERPVVIGGCVLDRCFTLFETHVKVSGYEFS